MTEPMPNVKHSIRVVTINDEGSLGKVYEMTYEVLHPTYSAFERHLETHFEVDNRNVYFAVIGNIDGGDSLEKFDDAGHELITGAKYALVYPMSLCVVGNNTNAFKPLDKLNEIIDELSLILIAVTLACAIANPFADADADPLAEALAEAEAEAHHHGGGW
ncbi:hypothetical protein GGI21_002320 [Coemansia aciculifera]|nr:hypothetical protein GGI21_002320 [Coemansia aciculifera]